MTNLGFNLVRSGLHYSGVVLSHTVPLLYARHPDPHPNHDSLKPEEHQKIPLRSIVIACKPRP